MRFQIVYASLIPLLLILFKLNNGISFFHQVEVQFLHYDHERVHALCTESFSVTETICMHASFLYVENKAITKCTPL